MSSINATSELARAYGPSLGTARLKAECEDFQVQEQLGFELSGQGEHVCLFIEKRDTNTMDVVRQLHSLAKVRPVAVGYCGLKDKRAVTRQWFSVHCAGIAEPDWAALESAKLSILELSRHSKKLRIGAHQQNAFEIRLRDVSCDFNDIEPRLRSMRDGGFPNYFGEQRFGRNASNIAAASALFARLARATDASSDDRSKKRFKPRRKDQMLLSAARSLLFNQCLSARVAELSWNGCVEGDVFQFDDGASVFRAEPDDALQQRLTENQIHPTGPMFGEGGVKVEKHALSIEAAAVAQFPDLRDGLLNMGMSAARRALRALPRELSWDMDGDTLTLRFALKRGSYATSLIREIVQAEVA